MQFSETPARHLFFTGKGGVGKTSVACATALRLARAGKRVLLVSTDPASNLDEVLGTVLTRVPTEVVGAPGLQAMNLDPEAAAQAYRERVVGPYRGILPDAAVRSIEEQLSGACTMEIAAFDEFAKLLGNPSETGEFDHVLFDTAPTGHTLRLLELPAAWSSYIEANAGGASCLGPLSGLTGQRALYGEARRALSDATRTLIVLVTRPEASALAEAERTRQELAALGIDRLHLVVNGVFNVTDGKDRVAAALAARGARALAGAAVGLARLPRTDFPLFPFNLVGLDRLAALLGEQVLAPRLASPDCDALPDLEHLVDAIARQETGVVFTMGKGGVGKSTIAARLARVLRSRGKRVHFATTDPAADAGELRLLEADGVRVTRIEPRLETHRYMAEVLAETAATLDAAGRQLVEEELRSPCTEEVAIFRAFARIVADGQAELVVIDTAPTGHTLLLLDAAQAYHREVSRASGEVPDAVRQLLPRLRDPEFAKVLLITLPEATPVHEAGALHRDLLRAGIQPFAWVVNQSLLPLEVTDPTLVARRAAEQQFVQEARSFTDRLAVVPFAPEPASSERDVPTHSNLPHPPHVSSSDLRRNIAREAP